MPITIPVKPLALTARGRNGWFTPELISIWCAQALNYDETYLEIFSSRAADLAPIVLRGTPASLRAALTAALVALDEEIASAAALPKTAQDAPGAPIDAPPAV